QGTRHGQGCAQDAPASRHSVRTRLACVMMPTARNVVFRAVFARVRRTPLCGTRLSSCVGSCLRVYGGFDQSGVASRNGTWPKWEEVGSRNPASLPELSPPFHGTEPASRQVK